MTPFCFPEKPSFRKFPVDITTREGETVEFPCDVKVAHLSVKLDNSYRKVFILQRSRVSVSSRWTSQHGRGRLWSFRVT